MMSKTSEFNGVHESEFTKHTLMDECSSLKKQCDELTKQKQAIEFRSNTLLAENQRVIEEKDAELKRLRQADKQSNTNENINYQRIIKELQDENTQLKEEVSTLRKTVQELEDWNGDSQENNIVETNDQQNVLSERDYSDLQATIDLLTSRNRQLETDLQRVQLQQRNNQLALERLDEYEETIGQLQEELDQLRSSKKKQQAGNNDESNRLLVEERKRYDALAHLLEETRQQSEERILKIENELKDNFEREKTILQEQIDTERHEREILQNEHINKQMEEQENRVRELNLREMFERQLMELQENVQSLESDKIDLNNQLDELREQLQSRDRQIQSFQTSTITPGSPSMVASSIQIIDDPSSQMLQFNSIYDQFLTLLPGEYSLSDNLQLSLVDRFVNLFEHFSTYSGTFSIIQEELDSLKQILIEKQDELEKLRTHLELTTEKFTQLQDEQSLSRKSQVYESDEDELEEILGYNQRASSTQSLLSITPGEKQQLIAQNELLSALLTEKEQELVFLQQADKTREDLRKNFEMTRLNLQQMEVERETSLIELNDIRNVLNEKLRENSSLKKEKMFFIEKLAEVERERHEQQAIIQIAPRQLSPEKERSPLLSTKNVVEEQNTEDPYNKLRLEYDELLDLSKRQHDESLSYYNEYTRIFTLYNELNSQHSQLQIDYESLQSLIQQKNEAYLQCQNELNTFQNLFYHQKKRSDDIDVLQASLNERQTQLEQLSNQQNQLEVQMKFFEEENSKFKSNQQLFEQIQIDLKRISHERDLAIVEKKQLEHEMELHRKQFLQVEQSERKLTKEVELLRDQLPGNDEQSQQELIRELLTLKDEHAKVQEININLNNQLQEQIKYVQNLQNTLTQFQQECEQYINDRLLHYQDSLREQISICARLTNENNELRQRMNDCNVTLSSAHRLNDEIQAKDSLINKLQNEIDCKTQQIIDQTTSTTRVEKQLVKSILLSYFHTPLDKQQEVIPILSALLGFTQEEYEKVMNAISNNYNNSTSTGWLTGWLGGNPPKSKPQFDTMVYHPDKSFAELLIQYVDQQSPTDTLQQPISKLPSDESDSSIDKQFIAVPSTIEHDQNVLNQPSSLPTSSLIIDKVLTI